MKVVDLPIIGYLGQVRGPGEGCRARHMLLGSLANVALETDKNSRLCEYRGRPSNYCSVNLVIDNWLLRYNLGIGTQVFWSESIDRCLTVTV